MAATVVGNAAIAVGGQEHHLSLPAIGTEGPAVAEHHRLSCPPVLVIDLCTVFRRNRAHCEPPSLSAGVVDLSCPSNAPTPLPGPPQRAMNPRNAQWLAECAAADGWAPPAYGATEGTQHGRSCGDQAGAQSTRYSVVFPSKCSLSASASWRVRWTTPSR